MCLQFQHYCIQISVLIIQKHDGADIYFYNYRLIFFQIVQWSLRPHPNLNRVISEFQTTVLNHFHLSH